MNQLWAHCLIHLRQREKEPVPSDPLFLCVQDRMGASLLIVYLAAQVRPAPDEHSRSA